MKRLVIGVIGHVDHGKTALVRALTGMETDRLAEEQARGISIALGFAHLRLDAGEVDFIDMPGHERFVRTMVAGATGIDAVLLAVDAREGVMPQTREHVEVAALLGVHRAIVAITRTDLAGPEAAAAAAAAAAALAAQSGLAVAEPVACSARTGAGLPALRAALEAELAACVPRADRGAAWLPVDRTFSMPGHGTVVTGTLQGGTLAVGATVEIMPGAVPARIRALQVHRSRVAQASPGQRVAVNLRGTEPGDVPRGAALAAPGTLSGSVWLSVALRAVADAPPLPTGTVLHLLYGTAETEIRVRLLDRDVLAPAGPRADTSAHASPAHPRRAQAGPASASSAHADPAHPHSAHPGPAPLGPTPDRPGTSEPVASTPADGRALAQLRCKLGVCVPAGARFVLRGGSPLRTLAGGIVLDPDTARLRRHAPAALARLAALDGASLAHIVAGELVRAGVAGVSLARLARLAGTGAAQAAGLLGADAMLTKAGDAIGLPAFGALLAALPPALAAHPDGLPRRALGLLFPATPASVLDEAASRLFAAGTLGRSGDVLRVPRPEQEDRAARALAAQAARMAKILQEAGLTPPDAQTLAADPVARRLLDQLVRAGVVVRAPDRVQKRDILFHRSAIEHARRQLTPLLAGNGLLVAEIGAALGISRKFSVPLLEHLDDIGFTKRVAERRVLAEAGARQ